MSSPENRKTGGGLEGGDKYQNRDDIMGQGPAIWEDELYDMLENLPAGVIHEREQDPLQYNLQSMHQTTSLSESTQIFQPSGSSSHPLQQTHMSRVGEHERVTSGLHEEPTYQSLLLLPDGGPTSSK
jgi:hypothetical protein